MGEEERDVEITVKRIGPGRPAKMRIPSPVRVGFSRRSFSPISCAMGLPGFDGTLMVGSRVEEDGSGRERPARRGAQAGPPGRDAL